MDKQIRVCLYTGIMHNNKNKQTTDGMDLKNIMLSGVKGDR